MEQSYSTTFNDIFDVTITITPKAAVKSLDPVSDLMGATSVTIPYTRKPKLNAASAFMTLTKRDKAWIGLLLGEFQHFVTGAQADVSIMHGTAGAKSSVKRAAQTWYEFVTELYNDKIRHRNDISEAQARQLVALIGELSANGFKLKGCGKLIFEDENGTAL